jgi:hypothetical protein
MTTCSTPLGRFLTKAFSYHAFPSVSAASQMRVDAALTATGYVPRDTEEVECQG